MAAMTELIEKLRDALDEDERVARDASRAVADHTYTPADVDEKAEQTGAWQAMKWLYHKAVRVSDPGWDPKVTDTVWGEVADHIARHDPARVLRQVTAMRKVLEAHEGEHECQSLTGRGDVSVFDGKPWALFELSHTDETGGVCDVVRALAEAYGIEAEG